MYMTGIKDDGIKQYYRADAMLFREPCLGSELSDPPTELVGFKFMMTYIRLSLQLSVYLLILKC